MHVWWVTSVVSLFNPIDCSPPGSSVHGILQARRLDWVATASSRDLPNPGIKPMSLMSPALAGRFFTTSTSWDAQISPHLYINGTHYFFKEHNILRLFKLFYRIEKYGKLSSFFVHKQYVWYQIGQIKYKSPTYNFKAKRKWKTIHSKIKPSSICVCVSWLNRDLFQNIRTFKI